MKKNLVALAVLAASQMAMAQSSVTLFGVIDAGVAYSKATGTGHAVGLANGGISTPRLGFRGTEDLGGGLAASFWLEGAVTNDVGAGASQTAGFDFARRSTVSLSGYFGEFRFGRDFAATYLPLVAYDVTLNRGLGAVEVLGTAVSGMAGMNGPVRVNNSVSYFLPAKLAGVYGQLQYALGERSSTVTPTTNAVGLSTSAANATDKNTGEYAAARFGYAVGAIDVSGSYGQFSDAVRTVGALSYAGDYKIANIGATYDFGVVKPMVLAQTDKIAGRASIADVQFNTYSAGFTAPFGPALLRVQASRYDLKNSPNDANKFSVGYIYNLSKRTAVYAEGAYMKNKGNATYGFGGLSGSVNGASAPTGGGKITAMVVGLKHTF